MHIVQDLSQCKEIDQSLTSITAENQTLQNDLSAAYEELLASEEELRQQLDELLSVLSAEDSKTLPLEIDHNTIIEQLSLTSKKTELKGMIITPDFAQFEQDLGSKEVQKLIKKNLIQNCPIFFEHEYQKRNPYLVEFDLSSEKNHYKLELKQKDCGI